MSRQFTKIRLYSHIFVFILTIVVLAMAANLGNLFIPRYNKDFFIAAIVIPSITILVLILISSYSQARTELFFLILLAIGWTIVGAWAQDIIGHVQCSNIASGDRLQTKGDGSTSARSYCNQMKVIEAFSWMNMTLFWIFALLLLALASRARSLGMPYIWSEPIAELPWFGERPGEEYDEEGQRVLDPRYAGTMPPGSFVSQQQPQQPVFVQNGGVSRNGTLVRNGSPEGSFATSAMPLPNGAIEPYVVQQQPGHSVVIQGGRGGQPTSITQIPSVVPR